MANINVPDINGILHFVVRWLCVGAVFYFGYTKLGPFLDRFIPG